MNFENFVDMMRTSCFRIVFGPLSLLPKSFAMMIFSIGGSGKGGYEAESGNEYYENYGQDG